MPIIDGPFVQRYFLGATIRGFSISQGWNEQSTNMSVFLVEDDGDDFWLKPDNDLDRNLNGQLILTPILFEYEEFSFAGLIQSYSQRDDFNGHPVYEVQLTSATQILDGVKIILSEYVGPTNDSVFNSNVSTQSFQVTNLLNVYGYLENGGLNFGNSGLNDGGILWEGVYGIRQAIQTLSNTSPPPNTPPVSYTHFGSYIRFRGHTYKIDFSGLPTAPSYYRLGANPSASLLEILNQFCEDAGVDYTVRLSLNGATGPHTISFSSTSRTEQQQLNKIRTYINSKSNIAVRGEGQEGRNDVTQAFIIGGNINVLQPMENFTVELPSIIPFWGFDVDGNPILGSKPDGTFFPDDDYEVYLNASKVSDILPLFGISNFRYPCKILEMRCALAGFDSWSFYMVRYKSAYANAMGLQSTVNGNLSLTNRVFVKDFINDSIEYATRLPTIYQDSDLISVAQRMFEFVYEQAQTYYGKKFLVRIPFNMSVKIVPDSSTAVYSNEPADAGFLPEGVAPLGLNYINENYFLDANSRFYPFVRFAFRNNQPQFGSTINPNRGFGSVSTLPNLKSIDANLSLLDSSSAVIQPDFNPQNTAIYLQIQQGEQGPLLQNGVFTGGNNIVFVPGAGGIPVPAMVCSIGNPVWAQPTDVLGGIDDIAALLNVDLSDLLNFGVRYHQDSFPIKINPPAIYPNGVAIAMKSNIYTYGPWGNFARDGKIEVVSDPSLVPWEYGGYDLMNQAALAKLEQIPTNSQVLEQAQITIAGTPDKNIGEELLAGGPIITTIDCSISDGGITTSYTMATFTPKFGVFNRDKADRIKKLGQNYQNLRRQMRQQFLEQLRINRVKDRSYQGFLYGTSYVFKKETPHGALVGHLISVNNGSVSGKFPVVYSTTLRESVADVEANDDDSFTRTAAAGWETLFRPISVDRTTTKLSHVEDAAYTSSPINESSLSVFRTEPDFQWFSWGDSYGGMNPDQHSYDGDKVRLLALRGPIYLTGWGYDVFGNPHPNSNSFQGGRADRNSLPNINKIQDFDEDFATGFAINSDKWKCGPIDLRWDFLRGVWSFPSMAFGKITSILIAQGGPVNMQLMTGERSLIQSNGTTNILPVYNFFNTDIPANTHVQASYDPYSNKYYVTAAECEVS